MNLQSVADKLYTSQTKVQELEKVTALYPGLTVDDAYTIQKLCVDRYLENGDALVGWKMGLTSKAKQVSVGVDDPIYGRLLSSMDLPSAEFSTKGLIHPRIEPEIAFIFGRELKGSHVTLRDVWLATEFIVPAAEVIDSRFRNFSFTLVDVIADNASAARFITGDQVYSPGHVSLAEMGVSLRKNGEVVQTGAGAAVLRHPVRSIVELVRMISGIGESIKPGMVVLTGGITEAVSVVRGDWIDIDYTGLGSLALQVR